ncbi:MAG: glycosyltransferase N-terminal domain-containing protein [Syntrophorhabdus sp.]
MWKVIYNILTLCALPFFIIIGLTNAKMKPNFFRRLFPRQETGPLVDACLIHGASIGEAVIATSLADYLMSHGGPERFIITTNTYYAEEMIKKKQDKVYGRETDSAPFDLYFSVVRFLDHYKPTMIVIVETEIWPNLIWQAKRRGIPVIIVNGRISDSTYATYKRLRAFMRSVFQDVTAVIAQSPEHRDRYIAIGMPKSRTFVTGNVKYYRPYDPAVLDKKRRETVYITFGSVKEKELEEIYKAITLLKHDMPKATIFIAPRELHLADVLEKDLCTHFTVARYSRIKDTPSTYTDIVVVDTVGDLMHIYARSIIAFVGGSLAPYGGQNMLEPLFVGTPVLFGPYTENFKDIAEIVTQGGAGYVVGNGSEIHARIMAIVNDPDLYKKMQAAGFAIVEKQADVMKETSATIMNIIEEELSFRELR